MVRGKPESFVHSRTDRGAEPSQKLLQETRQIYNRLKAEILSTNSVRVLEEVQSAHRNLSEYHRSLIRQMEQLAIEQDQKTLAHNIELKRVTSRNHILLGTLIATILAGIGTVSTLAGSANAGHDLRKIGDESIDKHTNASSRPRS